MQITAKSLLIPFTLNWLKIYAEEDKKYTTSANPATIKRFGP
jgi:hypothetical protein